MTLVALRNHPCVPTCGPTSYPPCAPPSVGPWEIERIDFLKSLVPVGLCGIALCIAGAFVKHIPSLGVGCAAIGFVSIAFWAGTGCYMPIWGNPPQSSPPPPLTGRITFAADKPTVLVISTSVVIHAHPPGVAPSLDLPASTV